MSNRKIMTLGAQLCAALALALLAKKFLGYSFFGALLLVGGAMAVQWMATHSLEGFDDKK